jgi:choline dehydrogenase-like flavoprotein
MEDHYDIVAVGSGFASMFFIHDLLRRGRIRKAAIVERGQQNDWKWQVREQRNTIARFDHEHFINRTGLPGKTWQHAIALGGGSNCWWANAMRFHPADFRLRSRYAVGTDWPLSYDDLEPFYSEAEDLMHIAGDEESATLFPRSRPFPQPRHRFSRAARLFKDRYPDSFFAMPQARARLPTATRNPCCSNSVCSQCPVNAKFLIIEDFKWIFSDPRVDVFTETEAEAVVMTGGRAAGVHVRTEAATRELRADFVALGANAIHNASLLLNSGLNDGPVGAGLTEQLPLYVELDLAGLDDGDGSSHVTGVGYNFAHGEFRTTGAGAFYETTNLPVFRMKRGKIRQKLDVTFLFDDLRQDKHFDDWSDYAYRGRDYVAARLDSLFAHLPLEGMRVTKPRGGGHAHLEGTTVMGADPETSVIDPNLLHHRVRNLAVLGSGAFPTAGAFNPTLTIAALSLRSARRLFE